MCRIRGIIVEKNDECGVAFFTSSAMWLPLALKDKSYCTLFQRLLLRSVK